MKLLSFLGETPSDALKKATKNCGKDAVVISTKKISSAAKDSIDMYEIIVSLDDQNESVSKTNKDSEDINQPTYNKLQALHNLEKEELINLKTSILEMQNSIMQMQSTLWNTNSVNTIDDLAIPLEFSDIYKLFEQNNMPQEVTYKILRHTIEKLPSNIKNKPKKVNSFFKLILKRMLLIKHEKELKPNQTKIMIFIGPTGVGKTTTLAKLAARFLYKLRDTSKIGMITLDSFRVGAAEQLSIYAKIMQIPLLKVKDPKDLSTAIKRLGSPELILIDTPGSSQYDKKMIELTKSYFDNNPDIQIEKNLILPTNIKSSDLKEIYNEFSILDIDNIIFTKLDETKSFGNIIDFSYEIKKPLTYFSIGQNVPEDLIVSDDDYLIDCFFNQGLAKI
jgi:flagellar biosynthesis protein FlhF